MGMDERTRISHHQHRTLRFDDVCFDHGDLSCWVWNLVDS